MLSEEQAAEGMSTFLHELANKEYDRMGDCFALGAIYRVTPEISLQRRIAICSRAVAILKAQDTMFQWAWHIEHDVKVVVDAQLKVQNASTLSGPH